MKAATLIVVGCLVSVMQSGGVLPALALTPREQFTLGDSDVATPAPTASATATPGATPAPTPTPTPTPVPAPAAPVAIRTPVPRPTPAAALSPYRNGTYYAVGSFSTPGGVQSIGVTLVISGGLVADSSATPLATGRTSRQFEANFINYYQPYVIGKNLATLSLSKISGASLTPQGFDNAVAGIRAQAN